MYLFPHKTQWASEYLIEKELILSTYGAEINLYHIGSTAIKGVYAKDCIDILGVVNQLSDIQDKVSALEDIGYKHKGSYGIKGREYFSKAQRKVHLHIFQTENIEIIKHLNFINIMSVSPKLVEELNKLKVELHKKYPSNKGSYQKEKMPFYNKIHKML